MQADTTSGQITTSPTDALLVPVILKDSLPVITEAPGNTSITAKNEELDYPLSPDYQLNRLPDIYLVLFILCVGFIGWIRIFYEKFLSNLFKAAFSYTFTEKLYADPGLVQKRISRLFFALYLISGGLYLFALSEHFNWKWGPQNPGLQILFFISIPSALAVFRYFIMSLTGYIFRQENLFSAYLFHHFINNRVLGITLLPFLLLIPFTSGILSEIAVYTSFGLVAVLSIIKIYRAIRFLLLNVVLIFYLFLYLCALEIMPLLVAVKYILSLA